MLGIVGDRTCIALLEGRLKSSGGRRGWKLLAERSCRGALETGEEEYTSELFRGGA